MLEDCARLKLGDWNCIYIYIDMYVCICIYIYHIYIYIYVYIMYIYKLALIDLLCISNLSSNSAVHGVYLFSTGLF